MTVRTRVPDDLDDNDSMRPFLDSIDRKLLKIGQLTPLGASPTAAEVGEVVNRIIAICQER